MYGTMHAYYITIYTPILLSYVYVGTHTNIHTYTHTQVNMNPLGDDHVSFSNTYIHTSYIHTYIHTHTGEYESSR